MTAIDGVNLIISQEMSCPTDCNLKKPLIWAMCNVTTHRRFTDFISLIFIFSFGKNNAILSKNTRNKNITLSMEQQMPYADTEHRYRPKATYEKMSINSHSIRDGRFRNLLNCLRLALLRLPCVPMQTQRRLLFYT